MHLSSSRLQLCTPSRLCSPLLHAKVAYRGKVSLPFIVAVTRVDSHAPREMDENEVSLTICTEGVAPSGDRHQTQLTHLQDYNIRD